MERGDIYLADLDPVTGREQAGRRPVIIVSKTDFNRATGLALVCPITGGGNFARFAGLAVALTTTGTETQGVVLCHQMRAIDLKGRNARKLESAPDFIVDDVLHKLLAILD